MNISDEIRKRVSERSFDDITALSLCFRKPDDALAIILACLQRNPAKYCPDTFHWEVIESRIRGIHLEKGFLLGPRAIHALRIDLAALEGRRQDPPASGMQVSDATFDMANYGNELEPSDWDAYINRNSTIYDKRGIFKGGKESE